ncbi:MAG: 50S ribosomal protein L25 [Coriobacteriia bacterium]|nr:50S ribosomal protein L25 [Coriobacteriia bacterium]
MSKASEITVTPRTVVGKTAHRLAAVGQIPAVLYGVGREAMPMAVDRHAFELWATHHASGSGMVELKVEGEKKPVNAMVREIQRSAVKGTILHVDFLAVSMDKPIHANVPLHLVNDPEGVRAGGVLTVNIHELNVEALPAELPESMEWDVSGMMVGDTLHVRDIVAPKGITLLDEPEGIVASVQIPRLEVEETTEELTEPEVIGSKPADEE